MSIGALIGALPRNLTSPVTVAPPRAALDAGAVPGLLVAASPEYAVCPFPQAITSRSPALVETSEPRLRNGAIMRLFPLSSNDVREPVSGDLLQDLSEERFLAFELLAELVPVSTYDLRPELRQVFVQRFLEQGRPFGS